MKIDTGEAIAREIPIDPVTKAIVDDAIRLDAPIPHIILAIDGVLDYLQAVKDAQG
mgnify:CR=1 FL=1